MNWNSGEKLDQRCYTIFDELFIDFESKIGTQIIQNWSQHRFRKECQRKKAHNEGKDGKTDDKMAARRPRYKKKLSNVPEGTPPPPRDPGRATPTPPPSRVSANVESL